MKVIPTLWVMAALLFGTVACSNSSKSASDGDDEKIENDENGVQRNGAMDDAESVPDNSNPSNYFVLGKTANGGSSLADKIKTASLVVLDFNADWCGPCRQFHPAFVAAAKKYPNVAFVGINVDEYPELMELTGQDGIPFVVVISGKGVNEYLGTGDLLPAENFFKIIDSALKGSFNDTSTTTRDKYLDIVYRAVAAEQQK